MSYIYNDRMVYMFDFIGYVNELWAILGKRNLKTRKMERNFEVMIELLKEQLIVQKQILVKLKSIEENLPSEVSTSRIERLLESIGDAVVNLE